MTRRKGVGGIGEGCVVLFQLGSLTAILARTSCHACGRDNQGLTLSSKRIGSRGAAITVCTICMVEAMAYHREYLAAQRKGP